MRIEPHTLIALVVAVAAEYGRGPEVNRHYIVAFIDGFLARAKQESSCAECPPSGVCTGRCMQ
jgi:hypothetical protein